MASFVLPGVVQFAFGFYGIMFTSMLLGLVSMVLFRPRTWCAWCPMGTMTQGICKLKNRKEDEQVGRKSETNCGFAESIGQ